MFRNMTLVWSIPLNPTRTLSSALKISSLCTSISRMAAIRRLSALSSLPFYVSLKNLVDFPPQFVAFKSSVQSVISHQEYDSCVEHPSDPHADSEFSPEDSLVVHVNFADGCCEEDQRQSSESALKFGASESRALNGSALSDEFRRRNEYLLKFDRSKVTHHKTPTAKVGYYVWKPYVILKTLCDPTIPWNSYIVWSDAGVQFTGDIRAILQKYMGVSDVSGSETEMLEAHASKRDAFLVLDADLPAIYQTNQIDSALLLIRKTRKARDFLEWWLAGVESPRVMTEEPSVLGYPDYTGFRNSNDDQTGMSLVFKKFGFVPFTWILRDSFAVKVRNLAKFLHVSRVFALQGSEEAVSSGDYHGAADARELERGAELQNQISRTNKEKGEE